MVYLMHIDTRIKLLLLISLLSGKICCQENQLQWHDSFNNLTWDRFLNEVESKYHVRFFYETDSLPDIKIPEIVSGTSFADQLNQILKTYGLHAAIDNDRNIFITRSDSINISLPDNFPGSQVSIPYSIPASEKSQSGEYMSLKLTYAEKRIEIGRITNDNKPHAKITGYVRNASDNAPLIGVIVRIEGTNSAVLTDVSGFYSLNVNKGDQLLIAGNLETKEKKINLKILSDGRMDIILEPKLVTLNAVVISADKEQIVRSNQMGYQRLATKEIREIPVVLGEQDVIKVSLLLPGVQSVGEGSSGVNVRGSPTDQNLFILNNIPVYNSSHLLGFFSVFNSDALKDFELYKSNIPAAFGGRLSSVFDIKTKQGNQNNFTANGGISPITTRLTVEGPISKKRSSYMIGIRSTYSDWILSRVDDPEISKSSAGFADAITNFSFELNKNNRLQLSSYHSIDDINIIEQNKYRYINNGASLSWNHLVNEKNNFHTSLIYSQYDFSEQNAEVNISSYKDNFVLKHGELKLSYTLRPGDKHTVSAGFNSILYQIDQGNFRPLTSESLIIHTDLESEKALESAFYISDDWAITKQLTVTAGLRYNYYMYLGPHDVRVYVADQPRILRNITDTTSYSANSIIRSYKAPDVRLSGRYLIMDNFSLKASFTSIHQYMFMLSNTIAISPTDKWKLSDTHLKPMSGSQYSLGVYYSPFKGKLEMSVETYLKKVRNLVDYKNGANLVLNEAPETDVVQGDLKAYGIEFMLNKSKGRLNGWLNYTWSKAFVTIDGRFQEERINNGKPYPANYDKPHAFNLVANFKFSRRFSVSSNVVYSTGRPITLPVGFYFEDNIKVPLYSGRNEYRIPDYFRVDLSLKLEGNLLSRKFAHGTWILSAYNVTARKNAYSIFYRVEDDYMKGYKLSVFGVPVISLTYSFKLGNYAN